MPLTIADVAVAAGVSAATVDRALNQRPGVHARTRARIMRAARSLGYVEPAPAASAARQTPERLLPVRLACVVPGGGNTFLDQLSRALRQAAAALPLVQLAVHRLDTYQPQTLADGLRRIGADADAVGVVALDHPAVRAAMRDLAAAGVRMVTLVSDISDVPRLAYVGTDNRAAGRLAGHLLGRLAHGGAAGEVALFAGSLRYRGHEEREMGFRRICAEDFPHLRPLPTQEIEDDFEQGYAAARAVLTAHPDLRGIYCLGGGVRGVGRALHESGRAEAVAFIGHELTPHTARFLVSGVLDAVIDQDAAAEASAAVALLAAAARGEDPPPPPLLRTQAIFRENIPDPGALPDPSGDPA